MKNIFTIFFLFIVLISSGQSAMRCNKTMSITDFLKEIESQKKKPDMYNNLGHVYIYKTHIKPNVNIGWDENMNNIITGEDARFFKNTDGMWYNGVGETIADVIDFKSITGLKSLYLDSCIIEFMGFKNLKIERLGLSNCESYEIRISVDSSEVNHLSIDGTDVTVSNSKIKSISDGIVMGASTIKNESLSVKNSKINSIVLERDHESFKLTESLIEGVIFITGDINKISVESNRFKRVWPFTKRRQKAFKKWSTPYFNLENSKCHRLLIEKNIFEETDTLKEVSILNYSIDNSALELFEWKNEVIDQVKFNNSSFLNNIIIDSVEVKEYCSIRSIEIPEYNSNFKWESIDNCLSIWIDDSTIYRGVNNNEIAEEMLYNEYISDYKKLFSMFKARGDLKSANACYAEMKDVETRRLKYLYEIKGGVDHYLNYQLNVFLKFFAEYGTSPIKSVKISGWVILIFAGFYFFFYSAWDKINRKFLIGKGDQLLSYFNSEQKLEELYSEQHKEDLSTFTQFKQHLKESKAEVPFFFMLFLKPLYWVAVLKLKGNKALYKRIEFLQGRWVDLTAGKKLLIGSFTFLSILTYGIYLIVIRSLNSLILSINTFTTLGFGDIPVVGVSRYVAILEGFLGWFLLSIFSVSLISQILQN